LEFLRSVKKNIIRFCALCQGMVPNSTMQVGKERFLRLLGARY
jgi:hypothetical protein